MTVGRPPTNRDEPRPEGPTRWARAVTAAPSGTSKSSRSSPRRSNTSLYLGYLVKRGKPVTEGRRESV